MKKIVILGKEPRFMGEIKNLVAQAVDFPLEVELCSSVAKLDPTGLIILIIIGETKLALSAPIIMRISNRMNGPRIFSRPLKITLFFKEIRNSIRELFNASMHFSFGPYHFDARHSRLTAEGRKDIRLTTKEIGILADLYHAPGRSKARRELLADIWDYGENVDTHTLETHIYRLRRKIEADVNNPKLLITTEDGYRLAV